MHKCIHTLLSLSLSRPHLQQVAFPRGTSELFATCSINDIRVWQTATNKEALRITVPNKECHCISFQPDGKFIVSGWDDGVVRAFTPQTGKLLFEIPNAQSKVHIVLMCF